MDPQAAERTHLGDSGDGLLVRYRLDHIEWPIALPDAIDQARLRDLGEGCLLWGAVGDALGRPNEGRSISTVNDPSHPRYVRDFIPWRGWTSGPTGTITDDTELTMIVAQSLVAAEGGFDAQDFCRRLVAWLPKGRGVGRATRAAITRIAAGEPWWEAGPAVDASGNGAAMRVAPVGLAHALDETPDELRRLAVAYSLPTHAGQVGVAAAVAMAASVAYAVRVALRDERLEPAAFLRFVVSAIATIETEPTLERRPGPSGSPKRTFLRDRIAELEGLLNRDPEEVLDYTWTGAFALESVPAALFCFLRAADDPEAVLLTAANTSHDTDTIAAMAGNLVGAYVGRARLEREHPAWWAELEFRDELGRLAASLASLTWDASQPPH